MMSGAKPLKMPTQTPCPNLNTKKVKKFGMKMRNPKIDAAKLVRSKLFLNINRLTFLRFFRW